MKRTQIYITEEIKEALDKLSRQRGTSISEIIREAVTEYISRHAESGKKEKLKASAGLWRGRNDLPNVSKLRREFERLN